MGARNFDMRSVKYSFTHYYKGREIRYEYHSMTFTKYGWEMALSQSLSDFSEYTAAQRKLELSIKFRKAYYSFSKPAEFINVITA